MAEEGRGRTQIRGEQIVELVLGRSVYAGPNVVHWHGAAPNEHVVQLTFLSGETSWLEPVTDDDYLGPVTLRGIASAPLPPADTDG